MNVNDFNFISSLLLEKSGLALGPDKKYLLESRLTPVAREFEMAGVDELVKMIQRTRDKKMIDKVTEAMTTNESFFFRDVRPFETFREKVLPALLESRRERKSFRIWCAAASSGQEAYSLAMILKEESAKLAGWRYEIVGTDISNKILQKARSGKYTQFEAQRGLPVAMLSKYFEADGDSWTIRPEIRSMVQYREFNLLNNPAALGRFDVVFCRNVLIYFDAETKSKVLEGVANLMPDDGVLFLGGAETVLGISKRYKPYGDRSGVYTIANSPPVSQFTPINTTRRESWQSTQT